MKINKTSKLLMFLLMIGIISYIGYYLAWAEKTNVNKVNSYDNFIVIPSIWNSYRIEEMPTPLPISGQILCINGKNLESKIVNGKLNLKEVDHFLGGKGYDVEIETCNANEIPFFFMTNINSIKNGKIKTVFFNQDVENPDNKLNNFDKVSLNLNQKKYTLTRTRIGSISDPVCKFKVDMSVNNQNQTIIERTIVDTYQVSGHPTLLWAGDIDNDGNMDLIIRYMNHQNDIAYSLFLSSFADKGKLVKSMKKTVYWTD